MNDQNLNKRSLINASIHLSIQSKDPRFKVSLRSIKILALTEQDHEAILNFGKDAIKLMVSGEENTHRFVQNISLNFIVDLLFIFFQTVQILRICIMDLCFLGEFPVRLNIWSFLRQQLQVIHSSQ